jgi:hypothetical protein
LAVEVVDQAERLDLMAMLITNGAEAEAEAVLVAV